jgi:hypothetical protein
MRRLFFLFLFTLIIFGGAGYYLFHNPQILRAIGLTQPNLSTVNLPTSLEGVDQAVANTIRSAASGNLKMPTIFSNTINQAANATVSATIAITPQELIKLIQEKGAQQTLAELSQRVQIQAGQVSTEAIDTARYQYCLGVVKAHDQTQP